MVAPALVVVWHMPHQHNPQQCYEAGLLDLEQFLRCWKDLPVTVGVYWNADHTYPHDVRAPAVEAMLTSAQLQRFHTDGSTWHGRFTHKQLDIAGLLYVNLSCAPAEKQLGRHSFVLASMQLGTWL